MGKLGLKAFILKQLPLLLSMAALSTVFIFQNCAEQPRVEDLSSTSVNFSSSFVHTGQETECLSCHANQRPTLTASGAPHDLAQDCIKCHTAGTAWAGQGTAKYDHTSLKATDSCITCHINSRPTGFVGIVPNQFNHSAPEGQGDCNSCHFTNQAGLATAGVTWAQGYFGHTPIPKSCATCHNADRPAANVAVPANTTKDLFYHNATFTGALDCVSCHTSDVTLIGKSWGNGNFNHKDPGSAVTINTCLNCHTNQRPAALTSSGFNHALNGQGDCVACHKTGAGISWLTAVYHKTGNAIPTACASCHLSNRPSPTTIVPTSLAGKLVDAFLHDAKYVGTRDCVQCHSNVAANKANIGKNFSGALFDHKSPSNPAVNISTCQDCHSGQRTPGVAQGATKYDHNIGGLGDCVSCHKQPGITWAGATFAHTPVPTSCSTCHENKRPASAVYYPSITSQNRFRHVIQFGGTIDCVKCHYTNTTNKANIGVKWSGGDYTHMDTNGVIVKTCLDCHQVYGNQKHCSSKNVIQDCFQCHNKSTQSAVGALPRMTWDKTGGNPTCK